MSEGMPDYNEYFMSRQEKVLYSLGAMAVMFGVGFLFYRSIVLALLLMLLGLKFPEIRRKQIIKKRKAELTLQFKDMLYALSSALSVGKSLETGLQDCLRDLQIIYPDESADILEEIRYILRGINMNETVESMFRQFADRAHLEDIENFTDVFITCKRTGGDLIEVMRSASGTIGEKIEVKQEIETTISGVKYEFKFLMIMPIVLIGLLSATASDYMQPVFTGILGRIMMTVAIALFIAAYFVGSKMMDIEL